LLPACDLAAVEGGAVQEEWRGQRGRADAEAWEGEWVRNPRVCTRGCVEAECVRSQAIARTRVYPSSGVELGKKVLTGGSMC
jgi:hypothetical protein